MKKIINKLLVLALTVMAMISVCILMAYAMEESDGKVYTVTVRGEGERLILSERSTAKRKTYDASAAYSGRYGYQLSGLERELYNSMTKRFVTNSNPNSYTYTFSSPISFAATVYANTIVSNTAYNNAVKRLQMAMQSAMDALTMDFPELYWLINLSWEYSVSATQNSNGSYTGYIKSLKIIPTESYVGASSQISKFKSSVNTHLNKLKKSFTDINDRYEVLLKIHDYICENAYYTFSGSGYSEYTPAPFFLGSGGYVCEGYAETFKIFCDKLGIPCVLVVGDAGGPHEWNYVQMEDEKWYLVDVTWDDDDDNDIIEHTYFLANYYSMGYETKICYERFPEGDFNDCGYMTFTYPTLSKTEFTRHYHQWESSYTIDIKATCTQNGVKSIHCKTCNAVKNKTTISKTGHSYSIKVTKAATPSADGKKTGTCKVCGKKASATIYRPSTITLSESSFAYSGKAVAPSVTVKDSKGKTLKNKTDYTVSYSSGRINPGRYTVKVTFKGSYSGSKSTSFVITPLATTKVVADQNTNTIKLTWSKVTGVTGYRIYVYNTKTKKYEAAGTTSKNSIVLKNLSTGKKYKFIIRGYLSASGGVIWGAKSKAFTTCTEPAGTKITKATQNTNSIKISWNKVSGATGYRVYKYNPDTDKFVKLGDTTSTSATIKNLAAGTKYKFKVVAYIDTDFGKVGGALSAEYETATKPEAPQLNLTSTVKNTVAFKWTDVEGESGYQAYYSTEADGEYALLGTVKADRTSSSRAIFTSGQTYYFRIRAFVKTANGNVYGEYGTASITVA